MVLLAIPLCMPIVLAMARFQKYIPIRMHDRAVLYRLVLAQLRSPTSIDLVRIIPTNQR